MDKLWIDCRWHLWHFLLRLLLYWHAIFLMEHDGDGRNVRHNFSIVFCHIFSSMYYIHDVVHAFNGYFILLTVLHFGFIIHSRYI